MRRCIVFVTWALLATGCDRVEAIDIGTAAAGPQHVETKYVRFTGVVHPGMRYTHKWRATNNMGRGGSRGPGVEHQMTVVAVTGPDWKAGEAIPLWVTEPSKVKDPEPWIADLSLALEAGAIEGKVMDYAGREKGFRTESGWQKAIKGFEGESEERSDPKAIVVMWPNPD